MVKRIAVAVHGRASRNRGLSNLSAVRKPVFSITIQARVFLKGRIKSRNW